MIALLLALVIDGSDPRSAALQWRPAGDSTYSTVWVDPVRAVFADSTRLYAHASEADLATGGPYAVAGGWVQVGDRLVIRLPDASRPTVHRIRVAGPTTGLVVTTPGAVVESVQVAFTGYEGILVMAPGVTLRHCQASNAGLDGIAIGIPASHCTVEDCSVWDNAIYRWPWWACKRHREEIAGFKNVGGPGSVFRRCTVRGTFDGIKGGTGAQPRQPGADTIAAAMRVESCTVSDVLDDGLEIETIDGRDVHVEDNTVQRCQNALSVAPIYTGPFYAVHNRFLDYREGALKNFGPLPPADAKCTGTLYFVGNTCASLSGSVAGAEGNGRSCGPGYFRNNIFYGHGTWQVNDHAPADYDYDLYWNLDDRAMIRWNGVSYYTLAAWRTAMGQEAHGIQADPLFVNPGAGDWRLQPGSPAANGGVCLPEFGCEERSSGDRKAWW